MRYLILGLLSIAVGAVLVGCGRDDAESILYEPDFVALVEADKVDHVKIAREPSGLMRISGWTKPDSSPGRKFSVEVVASGHSVTEFLRTNEVGYSIGVAPPERDVWGSPVMLTVLMSIVWFVVGLGVSIFLLVLALRFVRAVERIADNTKK